MAFDAQLLAPLQNLAGQAQVGNLRQVAAALSRAAKIAPPLEPLAATTSVIANLRLAKERHIPSRCREA